VHAGANAQPPEGRVKPREGASGLSKLNSLGRRPRAADETRVSTLFQASPATDGTSAIDIPGARGGWSRRIP
jgi:hypothetical protein